MAASSPLAGLLGSNVSRRGYSLYSIAFCCALFLVASLPFFLTDSPIIQLNDNLDGTNLVLLHSLEAYGALFSFDAKVPVLHGLSRLFFPSELKVWGLLSWLFSDFLHTYLANYLLKLVLGYASMRLFLKNVIAKDQAETVPLRMAAACFAILPCQPENALPFASVPLILYLFHRLYHHQGNRKALLAGIFCYPLLSDFSRFGLYILFILGLFFLRDILKNRRVHRPLFAGLVLLSLGYVITEYRLFYTFLYLRAETIREEFTLSRFSYFNLRYILEETLELLLDGQYHFAETVHKYLLLPTVVVFMIASNLKAEWKNRTANRLFAAFAVIIAIKLVYLLVFVDFISEHTRATRIIQLDRLYIFLPVVLYSLFFIVLDCLYKHKTKLLPVCLATAQAACIIVSPGLYNDVIKNIEYSEYSKTEYCINEYFSSALFKKIKRRIHYKGEWSVAVGFHPAVLLYNSIHTLDGYFSYYPLAYKRAFRNIIAPELAADPETREYFDYWGCRAYIFNEETSGPGKRSFTEPVPLRIDAEAFTRLGGRYVFSRAQIANSAALRLAFLGRFTDPSSPYVIYVYAKSRLPGASMAAAPEPEKAAPAPQPAALAQQKTNRPPAKR